MHDIKDRINNLAHNLKRMGIEEFTVGELNVGLLRIVKYFALATHYSKDEVFHRLILVFKGLTKPVLGTEMYITIGLLEELSGKEYAAMNMSEKTTTRYKWLMSVIERE